MDVKRRSDYAVIEADEPVYTRRHMTCFFLKPPSTVGGIERSEI